MSITDDPNHPGINKPQGPGLQNEAYLVLSESERARGLVRPVRQTYVHKDCGTSTKMGYAIAETYARNPKFYGATWCVHCQEHVPVDECVWEPDGSVVGS